MPTPTRRAFRIAVASITAAVALSACGGPTMPATAPSQPENAPAAVAEPSGYARMFITYYAAYDNDPAGSTEIAYGNERHPAAGGTGTYDDPVTLATDPTEIPPGTVIYYPAVRKYFVMEDDCAECIDDWRKSQRPHIDLWMSADVDRRVLACETALTPPGQVTIEVNPARDRPVDTRPLFDPSGRCWSAAAG